LVCQPAIQVKYRYLLVFAQFLQQTASLQTPNIAHTHRLLAPSCTPQQYLVQIYHSQPLCFFASSANGMNHIIKQQNIYCAIFEGQQIFVLFSMVIAEKESFRDLPMQTEVVTWTPDNQQLDTFTESMVVQLLGNLADNLLWLSQQPKRNIWPWQMLLVKQLGYNYSWAICKLL
jgi:hypothetical protein